MEKQFLFQPSFLSNEKQLRAILDQLAILFKDVRRYSHQNRAKTWQFFHSLSKFEQEVCVKNAALYLEICQDTLTAPSPAPLSNDNRFIWYALKKLGLVPTGNLFELLDDSYVIEIYNPQGIQVFRNYRFFEISSYNFAELFIYPWHQLYRRDESVDERIIEYSKDIFSGKVTSTLDVSDIPSHSIEELFSPESYQMQMQHKFFAPLKSKTTNDTYGAALSEVQVIGQKSELGSKGTH